MRIVYFLFGYNTSLIMNDYLFLASLEKAA